MLEEVGCFAAVAVSVFSVLVVVAVGPGFALLLLFGSSLLYAGLQDRY